MAFTEPAEERVVIAELNEARDAVELAAAALAAFEEAALRAEAPDIRAGTKR